LCIDHRTVGGLMQCKGSEVGNRSKGGQPGGGGGEAERKELLRYWNSANTKSTSRIRQRTRKAGGGRRPAYAYCPGTSSKKRPATQGENGSHKISRKSMRGGTRRDANTTRCRVRFATLAGQRETQESQKRNSRCT